MAQERDAGEADKSADFDAQSASVRPGGEAAGGIAPQPGDPAAPDDGEEARREMRRRGFGDHKGAEQ